MLTPGYSLFQVVWVRYGTHILLMLLLLAPRQGRSLAAHPAAGAAGWATAC